MSEQQAPLSAAETLSRWPLEELDAAHAFIGIGPEWMASDRRALLAEYHAKTAETEEQA